MSVPFSKNSPVAVLTGSARSHWGLFADRLPPPVTNPEGRSGKAQEPTYVATRL